MPDAVRFVISNVMAGHSVTSKSRVAIGQYSCGLGSFPMQEETGHLCGGAGIIFSRAMAESIVAQKEKCIEAWLNPTLFNLPGWGEQYDMGELGCALLFATTSINNCCPFFFDRVDLLHQHPHGWQNYRQ
jgi:hypothetical protein